jgi:serine/threonine protein kinase
MADVFEAWDRHLERRVAIKRYRDAPYGMGLQRFMTEAELLGSLSHPRLLTIFDMSFDGERPYLVLSLATGGTLRDRLDTGALLPSRVAEIGASVAEVLAYVHTRDIVHRDVKPSNVLFDDEGECYLADFGIARAMGAAHLTDSKEFVGTAAYLAPEQVAARSPGPPADVYALGLVLLECLTGYPEYQGTDVEVALARLTRQPRIPASLGLEWQAVLSAMTAADPAERPNAERCVTWLRALEAGKTVPMDVPKRRLTRIYAGATAAASAILATIAFTLGTDPAPGPPTWQPEVVEQPPAAPEQQTPVPAGQPTPAPPAPATPAGQADVARPGHPAGPDGPGADPNAGKKNGNPGKGHGNEGPGKGKHGKPEKG